jgi:F0F1-type ATP synthase membrane subunit c/vacuolar-type H+-ATPase subunit K
MLQGIKARLSNTYLRAGVLTGLALASVGVMAQETDPFTSTMTSMTTKVAGYGAALVGLAAVGVGFGIGIKYVKKIRGAA